MTTEVERLDYSEPPPGYTIWISMHNCGWQVGGKRIADNLPDAWGHYKTHSDPPGLLVFPDVVGGRVWWVGEAKSMRGLKSAGGRADALAAAWAWYDRRHAIAKALEDGCFCSECGTQDAHVEVIDERTCTQPWCTECDIEMGTLFDDVWPRCLTWSDEQAHTAEDWLLDSTAEMPEVLRG